MKSPEKDVHPPGPLVEMNRLLPSADVVALCQPGGGAPWQAVCFTPQQRRKYKNNLKREALHYFKTVKTRMHTEIPSGCMCKA